MRALKQKNFNLFRFIAWGKFLLNLVYNTNKKGSNLSSKKIVGKVEKISILDLELFDLDAKVDTGADSNALHCDDIHVDEESKQVSFVLLDDIHPAYHGKKITHPIYKMKRVKSSNGQMQIRPSIKVKVDFFNTHYESVISLTNRADMKFPMLIGRKFLHGNFLVDVSKEYLSSQKKG